MFFPVCFDSSFRIAAKTMLLAMYAQMPDAPNIDLCWRACIMVHLAETDGCRSQREPLAWLRLRHPKAFFGIKARPPAEPLRWDDITEKSSPALVPGKLHDRTKCRTDPTCPSSV